MFGSGARSQWKFEYDAIDLKLGRAFLSCNCLTLNPYIGVKAARIKQRQEIDYSGFTLDILPPISVVLNNIKKNQFRGIGPSVGVEGSWEFWSHLNLRTAFQAALLYGKFNVKEDPSASVLPNMVMFELSNTKRNRVRPTIDASIGIDWDYSFCGNYGIELGIGYEIQYWWNQWQATSSFATGLLTGGTSPQGDLSMQGLTLRGAFLF